MTILKISLITFDLKYILITFYFIILKKRYLIKWDYGWFINWNIFNYRGQLFYLLNQKLIN